jgi:hypothetical protein
VKEKSKAQTELARQRIEELNQQGDDIQVQEVEEGAGVE